MGVVGRVLVAAGVLLIAFVGYQLWGTGIQEAQAQRRLEDEFERLLASATTAVSTTGSTTGPTAPASEPTVAPTSGPSPDTSAVATVPDTTAAATVPVTPPTTPARVIAAGDPVALLELPTIGLEKIVVAGVGAEDLRQGPGHYPDTPLPGQLGNVAIAGHRTTYGAPFYDLDQLEPGDEVVLTTPEGRFVYRVTEQFVVSPSDYSVIGPTGGDTLTLTTCHPRYSARERLIVRAAFDADASTGPLAVGTPNYLSGGTAAPDASAAVGSTDPGTTAEPTSTVPADTTLPAGTTVPADTTVPDTSVPPETAAPTTPPTVPPTTEADLGGSASADALEQGWFDDPDAWPQVALWGGLLTLVAVGAWRLSRRTRRNLVGFLAGIVPFVVVLYFFFENANRLLPPNL
jgi:sortase A